MLRVHETKDYRSIFDDETGAYLRTGLIRDGRETDEDPFMAPFPELLDVGIMGSCAHGRSGLCAAAGIGCYQDGLHAGKPDMALDDFRAIAAQAKGKTFQIALGGCGDPDQHERFEDILKACRENGIVPNYTTSGFGMTERLAALTKAYCGAAAVSWYRGAYTYRALKLLTEQGVKTNVHYVLGRDSVDEAIERLRADDFPAGVNAVVFLLHKPVGLGTKANVLSFDDPRVGAFFAELDRPHPFKVGMDSCTVPGAVNRCKSVMAASLDTCEGARWSAYISPDMKMMPCSFDNQAGRWAVDLRTHTMREAWRSEAFENFRARLRAACPGCEKRALCMGGCPIVPEIVLCERKEKTT